MMPRFDQAARPHHLMQQVLEILPLGSPDVQFTQELFEGCPTVRQGFQVSKQELFGECQWIVPGTRSRGAGVRPCALLF